jgi:dTDP-glucose 4,6-dehydratase
MIKLLVTGGCGFIGSHFVEELLKMGNVALILNIDKLTYAANKNLAFSNLNEKRYIHYAIDINDTSIASILKANSITHVVHFAAESHVDNSIKDASEFIKTNICGTYNLINSCKNHLGLVRFIHVSTDEVFGSLSFEDGPFSILSPYRPNSPYAASKAASDLLVRSYARTHKLPAVITNCSNNFGPRQFGEKLIPLLISKLKEGKQIPIYGDGKNIRDWIYVKDHVSALVSILLKNSVSDQYLIGGDMEISNIDLVKLLVREYERLSGDRVRSDCLSFVEDRKGHDLRYSIDNHLFKAGFPDFKLSNFNDSIEATVKSYL